MAAFIACPVHDPVGNGVRPAVAAVQDPFREGVRPPVAAVQDPFGVGVRPSVAAVQESFGEGVRLPVASRSRFKRALNQDGRFFKPAYYRTPAE